MVNHSNVSEEEARSWRKDDLEVMKTGKTKENIINIFNAGGEMFFQQTTRAPLIDENEEIIGVIGIATDISDRITTENSLREAKEKAEIANKAKTDFLATVSHELRTPLNGIIGMSDILKRQNLSKDRLAIINDIHNSGTTLLSLINDILDLSKIESKEFDIDKKLFNLKDVLKNVTTHVSAQAKNKQLALEVSFAKDTPLTLLGDDQRLYQILINLTGNAIKFTEKGKVTIKISCTNRSENEAEIAFAITDTGIGIAKENIEPIFERFNQVDDPYNKRYSGTGLGLNIVKRLVEMMNGEVSVTSKLGKGSTFVVNLSFSLPDLDKKINQWQKQCHNIHVIIATDNLQTGSKIFQQISTPALQLVSSKKTIEVLQTATKKNMPCRVLIITDQNILKTKDLQIQLRHFGLPMVIYCSNLKKEKLVDEKNIVYASIDIATKSASFGKKLTEYWKSYNEKQSTLTNSIKSKSLKILLVEDNLINQRVAIEMLTQLGYQVDIADNGISAIEKYLNDDYKLILMDVGLPDMNGFNVTQKIRASKSKPYRIPIIALTAYASEKDKEKCLAAGMDGVITKPITMDSLQAKLTDWII